MKYKLFTIANIITLARLVMIPFFFFAILKNDEIALILFTIIVLTDKLDGVSARLMNQETELGRALDGFTDGILIGMTLLAFVLKNKISYPLGILLLTPKIINFVSELIYIKKQKRLSLFVTATGKISTGLLYVALASVIINFVYAYVFFIAAIIVLYVSMVNYLVKAIKSKPSV